MDTENQTRKQIKAEKKSNIGQYIFVIRELTSREIKRKYARSYLGIIWSVLQPLLNMLVLSLIFSTMFKRSIDQYPLYLLSGQLIYGLISNGTSSSMTALVDNKTLLIKAKLPKQTFILSRIYTSLVNFGYSLIAYALVMLVFRVTPSWKMLLLIPDVLLVLIFTVGLSYLLATVYVFFADIKHLYGILLTLWMYLSALFYPVSSLPEFMQQIMGYNPIYLAIYIARECMIYDHIPHYSAWVKLGIYAFTMLGIGILCFKRKENKIMQVI